MSCLNGHIFEYSTPAGDAYNYHHTYQQTDGIEINFAYRLGKIHNSQYYQQAGPCQGYNGTVNFFRNDYCIHG
jgi:hypothetical protein